MRALLAVVLLVAGCGKPKPTDPEPESGAGDWERGKEKPRPSVRHVAPKEHYSQDGIKVFIGSCDVDGDEMFLMVVTAAEGEGRKASVGLWQKVATLRDDLGNSYRSTPLGFEHRLAMESAAQRLGNRTGSGPGPIYSDRPRIELIRFERPVKGAKYLDLDLNGKAIGQSGKIQFRIPSSEWAR